MRTILIVAGILLMLGACTQPQGYKITGNLPGAKDGTIVQLMNEDVYPSQLMDSTVVKNERFVFQETTPLAYPKYCRLLVDPTPDIADQYQKKMKAYTFFVGNGTMHLECPVDSLPNYFWGQPQPKYQPVLTGSPTQDLYLSYKAKTMELSRKSGELWQQYLEVYHRPAIDGVFHTEEGMKIVRERIRVNHELNQAILQFIRENNNSVVSLLLARNFFAGNITLLTKAEINSVLNTLDPSLQNAPMMKNVREEADKALNVAKGEKYYNIELTDLDGKKVNLSDYVKPGVYNMLEFWASWCGPCRGEIPHLRHVYDVCGKDFNMISISIDDKDADWKKAVKEENMAWTQLCDQKGWKGPVVEVYQVHGVPFCLILDPEGKIVIGGVRGAELDVVLQDALGEKAGKL